MIKALSTGQVARIAAQEHFSSPLDDVRTREFSMKSMYRFNIREFTSQNVQ